MKVLGISGVDHTSESFVVRGTSFSNLRKYLDNKIQPELFRSVIEENSINLPNIILATSSYPIKHFIHVLLVSEKTGKPFEELSVEASRYVLEEDMNGIYKIFPKLGGAWNTFKSFSRLASTYCNYSEYSTESNEKGCFQLRGVTYASIHGWNKLALEGAIAGILNVCKTPMKSIDFTKEEIKKINNEPFL